MEDVADVIIEMKEPELPMYYITMGKNKETNEDMIIVHEIKPDGVHAYTVEDFNKGVLPLPCRTLISPEARPYIHVEHTNTETE